MQRTRAEIATSCVIILTCDAHSIKSWGFPPQPRIVFRPSLIMLRWADPLPPVGPNGKFTEEKHILNYIHFFQK